jgi:ligand-binding sensor domain-containing protein
VLSPSGKDVKPLSLVLDGQKNVWVSVSNCSSAFKLDSYGNLLSATAPFNHSVSASPVCFETDKLNNLHVSYTQGTNGLIARYNPDGTVLGTIESLYSGKIITQILCDNTNHFWTSVLTNPSSQTFTIEKRSFDWNLIEYIANAQSTTLSATSATSFGPYSYVNHMCLDRDQNLWITHNQNNLTRISNNTYESFTTVLSSQYSSSVNKGYDYITGLGTNFSGKIHAINSAEGLMYVVDNSSSNVEETFNIKISSATAGDWTGFNWINKYIYYMLHFMFKMRPLLSHIKYF